MEGEDKCDTRVVGAQPPVGRTRQLLLPENGRARRKYEAATHEGGRAHTQGRRTSCLRFRTTRIGLYALCALRSSRSASRRSARAEPQLGGGGGGGGGGSLLMRTLGAGSMNGSMNGSKNGGSAIFFCGGNVFGG